MTRQWSTQQPPARRQHRQRTSGLSWSESILLVVAGALSWLVKPTPAHAEGCGPRDLAACVNAAQYAFWHGVAGELWSVNRVFLTLAYQLDVFRAWLIQTVFTSVFATIKDVISPALAPMATLAVLVSVLCFLLMPLIGRVEVVNIRRALIWIVVAPLLLGIAGQGLASAEQFRTTLGQTMFAAAQSVGSVPRLGAMSGEMNSTTTSLYPFSGCGGALERPFTEGGSEAGIFMDDLAASMMYADAEDIHCPLEGSGPGSELPDGFYSPAEGGPSGGGGDYATTQSVSDMPSSQSAEWVRKLQRGVTRLLMGVVPSLLAVMNAIIQLLFALALVLLFIALPLGLLLVFFTDTAAGVTGLARRMVSVLQTSWSSSLLLGIVFVALLAASALGNVAAFVGLSVAGILLTLFIIFIAVNAFMSSVQAVAQTVSLGTGITGSVAKVALAGATGGVGAVAMVGAQATKAAGEMGLDYAVARRAGTSRRYALGTAAGRIRGVARVGGLAAALGMGNEVTDGIYTGERGGRSREGYRLTQRLATADAAKKDANQQTMREREQERDLQWIADRARRGSQIEEAGRIIGGGVRTVRHPLATALSAARAVSPGAQRITELSGDLAHATWERTRAARASVVERMGDTPTVLGTTAAVFAAGSHRFTRDARSGRMVSNGRGGVTFLPRVPAMELPAHALRERVNNVNAGRLLQLGHHLQYNPDGTVTFWHPQRPAGAQDQAGQNTPAPSAARGTSRSMHTTNAASGAGAHAGSTVMPRDASAGGGSVSTSPSYSSVPSKPGHRPSQGATSSGSTTGAPSTVASSPGKVRRSRVYPAAGPQPVVFPTSMQSGGSSPAIPASGISLGVRGQHVLRYPSHRIRWARGYQQRVQSAQQDVASAEARLVLVRQGAVLDSEAAAEQAVATAAEDLATIERHGWRLHPPVRRAARRVQPGQRRAALERQPRRRHMTRHIQVGVSTPVSGALPAEALMEEAARHNQAIAVVSEGVLARVPNDAPPGQRLEVPVAAVRDLDGLLQAGYRVYQSPRGDLLSMWPGRDAPGARWFDAGTSQARPDLLREQRRLQRKGLIAPITEAPSGGRRPASAPSSRRRRTGPRQRTRS